MTIILNVIPAIMILTYCLGRYGLARRVGPSYCGLFASRFGYSAVSSGEGRCGTCIRPAQWSNREFCGRMILVYHILDALRLLYRFATCGIYNNRFAVVGSFHTSNVNRTRPENIWDIFPPEK